MYKTFPQVVLIVQNEQAKAGLIILNWVRIEKNGYCISNMLQTNRIL